ncbi:MAG TPA: ATP synthase F0 subunit B [Syntrophales bacterium]|nr:ATP synthase F0 subunit B [Syntrophales bacterium]
MVELNSSLWIQMVNFLVMIFVLNVLLYKPVLGVLERRKKHLQDLDEEVTSLDRTVKEKEAAYEEKLRQARQQAMTEREGVRKEASEEAKVVMDQARGEISTMMDALKTRMDAEMKEAKAVLKSQAEKISLEISEKVLGRTIQ